MKHWTHFAYRIDQWTDDGESIVEHVADVEDFQVAMATYHAAWFAAAPNRSGGGAYDAPSRGRS